MTRKEFPLHDASALIVSLKQTLADHYLMMVKYHNYHRNVTGEQFFSLHDFFEEQYEELFERVDEIAETIRQYRVFVPATTKEFCELSDIKEYEGTMSAGEMLDDLLVGHRSCVVSIESGIKSCDELHDEATHDMLNDMMSAHRKTIWMLEAASA